MPKVSLKKKYLLVPSTSSALMLNVALASFLPIVHVEKPTETRDITLRNNIPPVNELASLLFLFLLGLDMALF